MEISIAAEPAPGCIVERELYERMLTLDNQHILELGCGGAENTRRIANGGTGRHIMALEVDRTALATNLAANDLPTVQFGFGGAEDIPAADATFDTVMMFKSLHHVPLPLMDQALREIHRVLRPGGMVYISEPVFAGAANEIMRLFHDEQAVRAAAFEAICRAVDIDLFELADEVFFVTETRFADFADYEAKLIGATHTEHRLSETTYNEVRDRFTAHLGPEGVRFEVPMRVDLLRKQI